MSERSFLGTLTMEEDCNSTTSSESHSLGSGFYRQMDFKEVISDSLVQIHQQGAFCGEINLRSKELLSEKPSLGCSVKTQDYSHDHSQHGMMFVKYTKESKAISPNGRNAYSLDEPTTELLQSLLTRAEMSKDKVGKCALATGITSPARNLELQNCTQTLYLPNSSSVCSNFTSAIAKLTHKPSSRGTLTIKSGEKGSVRKNGTSKGKQLGLLDALKQKDLDNRQIATLLLMKHQELREVKEISKMKDMEVQLMAEKLKREEQKNFEASQRYQNACEDMRKKLCIAKSNNESFAQQLSALLEKYERLKMRASGIKERLLEERAKKKTSQNTGKKIKEMAEELLRNQTLLERQRDAAARELSACKKKIQAMEEEHKKNFRIAQRAEEELSAFRAEHETLRDELCKTQEENKKLMQALESRESEKGRVEENLLESQNVLKQLNAELDESKLQRESMHQLLETTKKELKLSHHRNKVERLNLQEQQKICMKQLEEMRKEGEALNEVVSKLKKDKLMLKEELEYLQKEKIKSETASKLEGERLREAVNLLERERELLLNELKDLRKDYFNLSDRITQRLGKLDQTDAPMCITDILSLQQNRAPKVDDSVPVTPSVDMIQHIRRKLEEEEKETLLTGLVIH